MLDPHESAASPETGTSQAWRARNDAWPKAHINNNGQRRGSRHFVGVTSIAMYQSIRAAVGNDPPSKLPAIAVAKHGRALL